MFDACEIENQVQVLDQEFCFDEDKILLDKGNYIVKIVSNARELDEALSLRFKVFNLELNEGLDSSYLTCRDTDVYDSQCDHLIIIHKITQQIVGTYRIQTFEMAQNGVGFYSDSEFRLEMMPWRILENSVELGRACILKEYRNSRTLFLLWCGIAQYLKFSNKRYLFGCCSLTSQDEQKGMSLWKWLFINNKIDLSLKLYPRLEYEIKNGMDFLYVKYSDDIPPLLSMYLRYGAKVIGKPAIDRDFKTIDYFLLLDSLQMPQASYDTFMQK